MKYSSKENHLAIDVKTKTVNDNEILRKYQFDKQSAHAYYIRDFNANILIGGMDIFFQIL